MIIIFLLLFGVLLAWRYIRQRQAADASLKKSDEAQQEQKEQFKKAPVQDEALGIPMYPGSQQEGDTLVSYPDPTGQVLPIEATFTTADSAEKVKAFYQESARIAPPITDWKLDGRREIHINLQPSSPKIRFGITIVEQDQKTRITFNRSP